jgi:hypothetical protein
MLIITRPVSFISVALSPQQYYVTNASCEVQSLCNIHYYAVILSLRARQSPELFVLQIPAFLLFSPRVVY